MPAENAEHEGAREELAALLAAEMAKARTEMRVIRGLWVLAAITLAAAVVLWLLFGGRDQFIARASGYDAQVLLPAWLALAGLLAASAATVLFMVRLMRGALGNIVEKQARK
ncbi:hypothetical protein KRR55_03705 [Paeniglutamicibacter sp. ABSL32-1]|uniref:hypothetical protein n=1 Tax=Paeniglutamicibacter quisquiliarum TaxID=2849498 RepID=UPI001C2DA6DE|nr:hypothetical protein [Paeniglutamicibacter quisquiliarum]MBV1778220.1 hypothetical protein [Paeniglutamicibacter quisquiliarum]